MIVIKHTYKDNEVIQAMLARFSSKQINYKFCQQQWNLYVETISKSISKSLFLAKDQQIDQGQLPIEWTKLRDIFSRAQGIYLRDWLHENYPLVRIISLGKPGELTMIEPLFEIDITDTDLRDMHVSVATQTNAEIFRKWYAPYGKQLALWLEEDRTDLVDFVPVDVKSLRAYVKHNEQQLQQAQRQNHISILMRNQIVARTILACAEYIEQTVPDLGAGLPQIISESVFGRRYYSGLNLQNAPKIVRHAALGTVWQYDLHVSVFTWRYNLVRQLAPEQKFTYTLEYIDEKEHRRQHLVNLLDIAVSQKEKTDIIKQLLTAIGFGSRVNNSGASWRDQSGNRQYSSVTEIIKSPQARERVLADAWLQSFIEEQNQISQIIFRHYRDSVRHIDELHNESGLLNRNRVLAYLYQHSERKIMNDLVQMAQDNDAFALLVHDGLYTTRPLSMRDLRECIAQHNPWADIERTEHTAWLHTPEILAHKQRILEEELHAHEGFIPEHIFNNYRKILMGPRTEYQGTDEYDNGFRQEPCYDPDLDPFLEE